MKKGILKLMLGSVILEAILVCIFILMGDFNDVSWKAIGSVAIIFGYSIPCLFYSKIYDTEEYKNIAIAGTIAVGIAALIRILGTWEVLDSGEFIWKIYSTANVVLGSLVFVSEALSYITDKDLFNKFRKVSIALITVLSIYTTIIVWTDMPDGFLARLYYVLIVLTAGAFISTLILTKIYKKDITRTFQVKTKNETKEEQPLENTQTIQPEVIQQPPLPQQQQPLPPQQPPLPQNTVSSNEVTNNQPVSDDTIL